MTRWVLHVDLDQFVAAVEVLRRPELRGRPVVVGGDGDPTKRGVVSTASYEARAYGVHSALPLRTAARRCPEAVFLPVDRDLYERASAQVMAVLREFDAVVEVIGWDEAFLEVSTDDPERTAERIQAGVREATELDCTVGIGQNKLQAKIATGYGKPAGVFRLTAETWFRVLGSRPTDALWGIGPKTAKRLAQLGIHSVRDLADTDPGRLAERFGPATGPWLVEIANGRDRSPVVGTPYIARSLGRETTYQRDLDDWTEVRSEISRLARQVADEVAGEQRPAVRIVVKVRYAPFNTYTHGHPLGTPTTEGALIEAAALQALDRFTERRPVRLLGVRAEFARPTAGKANQEKQIKRAAPGKIRRESAMEGKQWSVQIYIDEVGDDTVARAVLNTRSTGTVTGKGHARRNPIDRNVPEIGDELAVARALADLADRLSVVAGNDIAQLAGPAS